jgi:phosphatidylethanolamine-binding protein (PEBP) family uncharacterized protein
MADLSLRILTLSLLPEVDLKVENRRHSATGAAAQIAGHIPSR